ncbi:hypothetical protein Tco_0896516 [Tanacetum coccineum]
MTRPTKEYYSPMHLVSSRSNKEKEIKSGKGGKPKTSFEEPLVLELKDLSSHLEYAFLESESKLPVIISSDFIGNEKEKLIEVLKANKEAITWKISDIKAPEDQEKMTFTCPYGTFTYRRMPFGLCNAPGKFQRCMIAIFHDMESNLVLNWEKYHFMVKEGIVLGHKISKNGIEVDKAKVDTISKLPPPTSVKYVLSFLGHVGFYRRFIKDLFRISRPMTKDAPFILSFECIRAFNLLKEKLVNAPIMVAPD